MLNDIDDVLEENAEEFVRTTYSEAENSPPVSHALGRCSAGPAGPPT
jgi:hypothetical protein